MKPGIAGRSNLTPYMFFTPFLAIFAVFYIYPLIQSLLLSLQQTFGPATSKFVYFDNFRNLFSDPLFWLATRNTVVYALASLLLLVPLALGLALILNRPGLKGKMFFRLVFFSPSLIGVAFVAVLFTPILAKNTGLLNVALNLIYPQWDLEFGWLSDYVMAALIVISIWMYVGFYMVYFLAALQNVDQNLVDAAEIDGAGRWHIFLHVTIPAIRDVGAFIVLLSLIGSFQLFELPYVMLNFGGGPENRGLTIVTYLYQIGFESADLGYASAIGWTLTLALFALAILQRQITSHSESG